MDTLDSIKSQEMIKEIESFCKKRNKSNRKLARDVAEWVDMAVNSSHGNETTKPIESYPTSHTEFGDLEIENDE